MSQLPQWISNHGLAIPAVAVVVIALLAGIYLLARRSSRSRSRALLLVIGAAATALLAVIRLRPEYLEAVGLPSGDERVQDLSGSLLWTAVAAMIVYLVTHWVQRALLAGTTNLAARHKIRSATSWTGMTVFAAALVFIWAQRVENVGVFLGIIGAGLALSMQEVLLCVAGWVLIVAKRPFDIGDRIEVNGLRGDVIDISIFQTSLIEVGNWVQADQSTGRMLIIPNGTFYRHPVNNYSKGFPFIWNEFATVVTFESDWRAAKAIMLAQAQEEAEKIENEVRRQITGLQDRYAIQYEQLTPIVYTSIADQGVRLTLRYLSLVRERRTSEHRIAESILDEFIKSPRIDFAYPTTRMFRHNEEGKPGMRAEPPRRADGAPGPQAGQPT